MSTAYDRIASEIRQRILSGDLAPGDQLPTGHELSGQYDVSHNTAREALLVLASQGLLTLKRGASGGSFVSVPDPEVVGESLQTSIALLAQGARVSVTALLEIRELLEVPAAEMAALRRTDEDLAAISESLFDPRNVDPSVIYRSTREFHAAVLKAAGNPLLELMAQPVFAVLRDRFVRERAPRRWWESVDSDHREILSHLKAHDQAGAREATRAHLRAIRKTYESIDRTV